MVKFVVDYSVLTRLANTEDSKKERHSMRPIEKLSSNL